MHVSLVDSRKKNCVRTMYMYYSNLEINHILFNGTRTQSTYITDLMSLNTGNLPSENTSTRGDFVTQLMQPVTQKVSSSNQKK